MFCRNCGKEVAQNAEVCLACGVRPSNGAKFCNNCGVETNANQEICIKCGVRLSGVSGAINLGSGGTSVEEGKIWAVISYFGPLGIIPLLTQKQNKFAMFHAKQGLALFIGWVILWVIHMMLWFIPFLGWIIGIFFMFVWLGIFILWLMGVINALQGKEWKMPIFGGFAEKLNF